MELRATPIFLIPRTLLLGFWCGACSISAIGESNGKSRRANYFQNSYTLESRYLDLPERLELPERPPKYWKDQQINREILMDASAN